MYRINSTQTCVLNAHCSGAMNVVGFSFEQIRIEWNMQIRNMLVCILWSVAPSARQPGGEQIHVRCARNSILHFDIFGDGIGDDGVKCGWQRNVCALIVVTNSLDWTTFDVGKSAPKTLWSTNAYNKQHAELEQVSSCVTQTRRGWDRCLGAATGRTGKQMNGFFGNIPVLSSRELETSRLAVAGYTCTYGRAVG